MSDLKAKFDQAQQDLKTLTERPGNDDLLSLYAHFKQATEGDLRGKRPGFTDLVGRAKYDARAKLEGTSSEGAMQAYIDKVNSLLAAAGK
jgi:acyl-CoA-binding protein